MTDLGTKQHKDSKNPLANESQLSDDQFHELEGGLEEEIANALDEGRMALVRELIEPLHYSDVSSLLERCKGDDRNHLLDCIPSEMVPDILGEVHDSVYDDVIDHFGVESVAAVVSTLDSDDAIQLFEELDEDGKKQLLDAMSEADQTYIKQGLAYPEDSAGRLMQREFVSVSSDWNVGQTIDFLRNSANGDENTLPSQFFGIFVVHPEYNLIGMVQLDQLLRSHREVDLIDIIDENMKEVSVYTDQEDVAYLFRQRDLTSAPVVDMDGTLVGMITIDDIVDVIHEETEEDIMHMGGVQEGDLYSDVLETTRMRFTWLLINLGTAILASVVISLFDATLEQAVALAILMPIVASMGGNAGTQTMTVTVRALAMKEISSTNASRIIGKEIWIGCINGIMFAVLVGVVTWYWFNQMDLGLVISMAMIVNMIVAGFAGTVIPILLDHYDYDPAISSSVFLTTVTDVVGFFAFLGLAGLILF